jgi:glucose-6-phosphate 1-dehydrogenase
MSATMPKAHSTLSGRKREVIWRLFIDNWRWQDVPFYLRTGKRLPRQVSEVGSSSAGVPHQSFPPEAYRDWHPSCVVLSIQSEGRHRIRLPGKIPRANDAAAAGRNAVQL